MPTTITELYQMASKAMLERVDRKERGAAASAAAVPHLTNLLEATFFEAHAAEIRDFGDTQLNRAALVLFAPDNLQHPGGLNLDESCAELPAEAKEALRAVRERVAQDRLPLLSLLQAEPLRMQSSHLSFQEYFTVRAICSGKHRLPRSSPPWKWGPFWANVVKLGSENGTKFGDSLLRAADVEDDELHLSGQLGGDRPTVLAVVSALLGSLRVLDLSYNNLGPKGCLAVAEALKANSSLTSLDLQLNNIGDEGARAIGKALLDNGSMTEINLDGFALPVKELKDTDPVERLDLSGKDIGVASAVVIASLIGNNRSLTSLDLGKTQLGPKGGLAIAEALKINRSLKCLSLFNSQIDAESGVAIAEALKLNGSLTSLNINNNQICGLDEDGIGAYTSNGINAICCALRVNGSLTSLLIGWNQIGPDGGKAIAKALRFKSSLTSLDLGFNHIGIEAGVAIAEALAVNNVLTSLVLSANTLGGHNEVGPDYDSDDSDDYHLQRFVIDTSWVFALAAALKASSSLTSLEIGYNEIGPEGGVAIAEALKVNCSLTSLYLATNQLGPEGGVAVAKALRVNNSLTNLDLRNIGLGNRGATAIAEALKVNVSLTSINLRANDIGIGIGTDGGVIIAEALKVNRSLTSLYISSNNIGPEGGKAVAEALGVNYSLKKLE